MDALVDAREELLVPEEAVTDFHVQLRGGVWCMEHFGQRYQDIILNTFPAQIAM